MRTAPVSNASRHCNRIPDSRCWFDGVVSHIGYLLSMRSVVYFIVPVQTGAAYCPLVMLQGHMASSSSVFQAVMTKGSQKMNAKIKDTVAARQAKPEAEQQKIVPWEGHEEQERMRKCVNKLDERRFDPGSSEGHTISEAKVRLPECNVWYRTKLEFTP